MKNYKSAKLNNDANLSQEHIQTMSGIHFTPKGLSGKDRMIV